MGDAGSGGLVVTDIVVDQIIGAARSSVYRRVLFLGPYARRVSFSSQQNRALNLVWALQHKGELSGSMKIAVVGGGVSGTILATVLQHLDHNVTLYEASEEVLSRQKRARHRYIHPTINRWPEAPIVDTTMVPYFDWIADICTDVLKVMKLEWSRIKSRIAVAAPVNVISFSESSVTNQVAIKTLHSRPEENRHRYDLVFVTSGFSDEDTGSSGLSTYWDLDDLDTKAKDTDSQFLVSGAGDGGLIDALRICHSDFDDGKITIKLAHELSLAKWPQLDNIERAEQEISDSVDRTEQAIRDGSEILQNTYLQAANEIPGEIKDWLNKSLRLEMIDRISLIAMERWPFSPMAAPIHKLLVAHAMNEQVISHTRARVTAFTAGSITFLPMNESGNEGPLETHEGVAVIRHGSSPNFSKFFKPTEQAAKQRLIERQKSLAPNADLPMWREGSSPLMKWPPDPPFRDAIRSRLALADKLVSRIAGMAGRLEPDELLGFVLDDSNSNILASLPSNLFGFPLASPVERTVWPAGGPNAVGNDEHGLAPGASLIATLNGRAGVVVADQEGTLFLLTATHVLWSPSEGYAERVIERFGHRVGTIDEDAYGRSQFDDIARIRLDTDIHVSIKFCEYTGLADPRQIFGTSVYLLDRFGNAREGYVSASLAPVRYRHAGGPAQTYVPHTVRIRPMDPLAGFAAPGDSGAPVVDSNSRLLGLILADDGEFGYVAPLAKYMSARKLRLVTAKDIHDHNDAASGRPREKTDSLVVETMEQMANFRRLDLAETSVELGEIEESPEE